MAHPDSTDTRPDDDGSINGGINLGAVNCPCCRERMPALRIPTGVHRMMWGGFVCPGCKTQLDKWGEPVSSPTAA